MAPAPDASGLRSVQDATADSASFADQGVFLRLSKDPCMSLFLQNSLRKHPHSDSKRGTLIGHQ